MQLEKHMLEGSVFCFDPGRQMISMLRRWEIGATFSKELRGLRAVRLGICDYFISTGKQPLEVACITRWNHTFVAITNMVMSNLLNTQLDSVQLDYMIVD